MKANKIAQVSVTINALAATVWKAITTPETIAKYLMGTHVITDWNEGSKIAYEGEYNGKKYHDKGIIKKLEPEKIFESTYWSSMGGKEDKPENYKLVRYELKSEGDETIVTLMQDYNVDEKEKMHAEENWKMVLDKLKQVVEAI